MNLEERLKTASAALSRLAAEGLVFSPDEATNEFCRHYLREAASIESLRQKAERELGGAVWKPLGRLLLIISEQDVLGVGLAFLAAYITGNKIRVKARDTLGLLGFLKQALKLADDEAQIADWRSGSQNDNEILKDIDGLVLAGGAELIAHFRKAASPSVRLIEFGPKISAAALGPKLSEADIPEITERLIYEVGLFQQAVCSSPRFILLENGCLAGALFESLSKSLETLGELDDKMRLAQAAKSSELKLIKILSRPDSAILLNRAFNSRTGWGLSLSKGLDPALWFERGFHLVLGPVEDHLRQAAELWPNALQTLGLAGYDDFFDAQYFTRFCPLGAMHKRPLTAPHDGFFELSALVSFVSREA